MKRLINSSTAEFDITDILKSIDHIVICNDVTRRPYLISCSSDLDEDELTEEQLLITCTDEELETLSPENVHTFTNPELLGRIAKVNYDALSIQQRELLRKEYGRKLELSEHAIQIILNMLKSCKSISYEGHHPKTNKFRKEFGLTDEDYLAIIQELEVGDFEALSRSFNLNHIGNYMIIFQPKGEWNLSNGKVLKDFELYVKLDIDETDGSAIAIISLHKAQYPRSNKKEA